MKIAFFQITDERPLFFQPKCETPKRLFPNINLVPGVFLTSYKGLAVDQSLFKIRTGRKPKLSEVGIAFAHMNVYRKFLTSKDEYAVVFEQDAEILDSDLFNKQIDSFLTQFALEKPVIGLFFHDKTSGACIKVSNSSGWSKAKFVPSFAVAYIISRRAARLILESQKIVWSVADWPLCLHQVDYLLVDSVVINHLSQTQTSLVGSTIRQEQHLLKKFLWIAGVGIFYSLNYFKRTLHIHWCFVLKPRIIFKFSKMWRNL